MINTGTDTGSAATPGDGRTAEEEGADGRPAAAALQRAILPTSLPWSGLGRYEVAARYRPAQSGNGVGGDWYDARLGPDGGVIVTIGDVAGHGMVAVAGMARIGNALRGLAVTGQPANSLLDWLNQLICSDESPERVASAAVCMFDADRPGLRWAQAGHPPPVLVSGGEARLPDRPQGLLLGTVPTAEYHLASEELAAGDVLFLYTDGLIERRCASPPCGGSPGGRPPGANTA